MEENRHLRWGERATQARVGVTLDSFGAAVVVVWWCPRGVSMPPCAVDGGGVCRLRTDAEASLPGTGVETLRCAAEPTDWTGRAGAGAAAGCVVGSFSEDDGGGGGGEKGSFGARVGEEAC